MSNIVPDDEVEAPDATALAAEKWFGEKLRKLALTSEEEITLRIHKKTRELLSALPTPPAPPKGLAAQSGLASLYASTLAANYVALPDWVLTAAKVTPEIESLNQRAIAHETLLANAWEGLCERMGSQELPGYIYRLDNKKTEAPGDPSYWLSKIGGIVRDAYKTGDCIIYFNVPVKGRVRIKRADLDLVLAGKRVARPLRRRRGRPPKKELDQLWVELCLVFHFGDVKKQRTALTKYMAQWCIDNDIAYEAGTIDDKVVLLLDGWEKRPPKRAGK